MLLPQELGDCWGVDTAARLTEAQYQNLRTLDLRMVSAAARRWSPAAPVYPAFVGRYCPLAHNGVGEDLTAGELVVGAQAGFVILVFQHVRAGAKDVQGRDVGWTASQELGELDAEACVSYLDAIGYSVTYAANSAGGLVPHVIQDMENVRNPGPDAVAMSSRWRDLVDACLRLAPAVYNGFNPGLTAQQLADLGVIVCRDAGPRTPPPARGFAYEQQEENVEIPGVGTFDVAHAHPDETGASLVGIAWTADPPPTDPSPPPEQA
jgi:hypothetical protein